MSAGVRGAVVALASFALLALGVAPATASTVVVDGPRVIYTAAAGIDNTLVLEEGNDFELRIDTTGDPVDTVPPECYDADGDPAAPHSKVTCNGTTVVEVHTLDGTDDVDASGIFSSISTVMRLGTGPDFATGSEAVDEIHGEEDGDVIVGGAGDDRLFGGDGGDSVEGDCGSNDNCPMNADGNDLVDGGPGDDSLEGNGGDDVLEGRGGQDLFDTRQFFHLGGGATTGRDSGNDTFNGGPGFDRVVYTTVGFDGSGQIPIAVDVTLDGVAGDGQEGEADDIGTDVEDVITRGCCDTPGASTVTGNASVNAISTGAGADTVDPGTGNDHVDTGPGDDTVKAVDGFADRVTCGVGTDVADVDEFDVVSDDCETVNVTTMGRLATEDAPPTVSWVTPAADGAELGSGPTTLAVNASDDVGVTQVVFLAGTRVLCTDTAAPFECAFSPTDADVGKATLTAVAYDGLQQTATAQRFVDVDRFRPEALGLKVRPKRDRKLPFRFRASGELMLPAGVSDAEGCRGRVQVRFKVGKKTISARKAKVRDDCTFKRKVKLTQRYRLRAKRLRVFATFLGNDVLKRKKAERQKVRIR